ncbi:MAG: diadenylate cyclase CdaA [Spirochaetia bacterium]|nr:diadenylate cyclase CdaA [Spirochaetia bacterium]
MGPILEIWYVRDIIIPIIDISIITFLLYKVYITLAQTNAVQLVKILVYLSCLYLLAYLAELSTVLWLFHEVTPVVIIFMGIIYQPELRMGFTRLWSGGYGLFRFGSQTTSDQIDTIINALDVLSTKRRGALIVFPRKLGLRQTLESGTRLNADLSSTLILTIFDHDTPLHDGAVVIQGRKIISAGCFLPLSEQSDIRKSFGARHRAALGMAEDTDAVVLIVSEETGALSVAYHANLYYDLVPETIKKMLIALLNYYDVTPEDIEEGMDEAE